MSVVWSYRATEMSDLYGSNESEDMSSFLQILLQNSSSSAATADGTTAAAAASGLFSGGEAVAESSTSINFSDPSCFFARESDGMNPPSRGKNLASSCEVDEIQFFFPKNDWKLNEISFWLKAKFSFLKYYYPL